MRVYERRGFLYGTLFLLMNQCAYTQQITLNLEMVIDVAQTNHSDSLDKNQIHTIKSAYLQLLYHNNLLAVHDSLKKKTRPLLEVVTQKYNHGETDLLEYTLWKYAYYDIENTIGLLQSQQLMVQNELKKLLLTDRDIISVEKTLYLYPIDRDNDDFTDFMENLNGYPEDSIVMNVNSFLQFKNKENALLQLVSIQNQLDFYENQVLPLAATFDYYAKKRIEAEEIDFTEYFMYISKSFTIHTRYLDMVNQYNQAALDLELLLK